MTLRSRQMLDWLFGKSIELVFEWGEQKVPDTAPANVTLEDVKAKVSPVGCGWWLLSQDKIVHLENCLSLPLRSDVSLGRSRCPSTSTSRPRIP